MSEGVRPLTGRRVLVYTLVAFGVVFGANMTLLYAAVGSFPGLVVRNSYVASQQFEAERSAQERLGWRSAVAYREGAVEVLVRDPAGADVPLSGLSLRIGRPTYDRADRDLAPVLAGAVWRAPVTLEPGIWQINISAIGPGGETYRQRRTIEVPADG
ncbi:MAG: FixH family protein [Pseudomonadota bacterium]